MKNAVVLFKTSNDFREELKKRLKGINVVFNESNDTKSIDDNCAENTAVIFGNPHREFLDRCHKLEWVQLQTAGTDGFINGELGANVLLSSATGSYGHAVSEYMVGLTFALCKKFHLYRDEQLKACWQARGEVKSIQGATIAVIGMGDIGSGYARRMKALGAYIIGVRRTEQAKPPYVDEMFLQDKIDEILPRSDIVAMALPGVKETKDFISRERLAKMKQGALLLNAGRGSAVDLSALCDALEAGRLGGAGLDVSDPEPLPKDHRLWKIENVIITPHIAGGRYMSETSQYLMKLNLENAERFMMGSKLKSLVDMATGYCAHE